MCFMPGRGLGGNELIPKETACFNSLHRFSQSCSESIGWKMVRLNKRERSEVEVHRLINSGLMFTCWEQEDSQGAVVYFGDKVTFLHAGTHRQINVDVWVRTQAQAQTHTLKHNGGEGSCITKGCSNRLQYFMNILPLSVLSSIFYFILACSAFFLWKKVSFLSISSQKIAGVRRYRQKKR